MFGTRKLGKTSAQRKALLRQQVTDLLENGKMETTFYRAKEVQPVVEKMITLGKKGDLAAYRKALSFITKEDVAHKLFKEIAPKYAERNGGYTRVTRTGPAVATQPRWLSSSWCNARKIMPVTFVAGIFSQIDHRRQFAVDSCCQMKTKGTKTDVY